MIRSEQNRGPIMIRDPQAGMMPAWYLKGAMSRPDKSISVSLDEAVAELKRNPSQPVHANVDGMDVEMRVVPQNQTRPGIGTRLAAIGPWEGITLDDLMKIVRESLETGESAAPPEMP